MTVFMTNTKTTVVEVPGLSVAEAGLPEEKLAMIRESYEPGNRFVGCSPTRGEPESAIPMVQAAPRRRVVGGDCG